MTKKIPHFVAKAGIKSCGFLVVGTPFAVLVFLLLPLHLVVLNLYTLLPSGIWSSRPVCSSYNSFLLTCFHYQEAYFSLRAYVRSTGFCSFLRGCSSPHLLLYFDSHLASGEGSAVIESQSVLSTLLLQAILVSFSVLVQEIIALPRISYCTLQLYLMDFSKLPNVPYHLFLLTR